MTVVPLRDRVLIQRSEATAKSPGGLIIPDSAKEKPAEGVIVAVGPGGILMDGTVCPLLVKIGDKVLFAKTAGTEIQVDGEERVLVREADILCVMRP
jgi:chaperonin GroES